jgi:trafficking protein particle complex subunit 9
MEFPPFASLGHVRILVIPVGNIRKQAFDEWANLIRSFETIRLGDIPPDGRDDHGVQSFWLSTLVSDNDYQVRFMPSPLSTGHLHLSFPSHPPPSWHTPLALLRPSDFPLGIIGIAESPVSSTLSSLHAQFSSELSNLFPPNSLFPLAHNCYVFEDGDSSSANLGDSLPGMVVIPSVMGNKELYIGTLIAELCSNILGEFSNLVGTLHHDVFYLTISRPE